MADTTFVDNSTVIVASWLNDVNDTVYSGLGGEQTASGIRTHLGLGTAALTNTGTSAGNTVVLDGTAKLPAVDGSQLTNITAAIVDVTSATGTLPVLHGGTGATTAGGARTNLGSTTVGDAVFTAATVAAAQQAMDVEVGVDVQAYDADIATVAASQVEMEAGTEVALRSMSPLRIAQAIAALSGGSADQVARDQIALTNMRLLLNSSVASGALYAGYQWELATDELGAASSGETYTAGTPAYYTGVVSGYTPTGSTFGDMTTNGGLAASFDGNISQANGACSTKVTATSGYVGKAFSSAQKISRVDTYGANDVGYAHATGGSVTINIYGNSSSPANATDGTLIGTSGSFTDGTTAQLKQITCDPTTAYQYVWAVINASSQNLFMAEVKYFTTSDVTLIPPASTSVSTAPTYMDAYFLWKDDSGSAVIGTDLTVELSRDNGTTYTTATLTNLASYDGTYSIIKARANVSAQPSGTSMLCRIKMLNSKLQRVAAPALYSE